MTVYIVVKNTLCSGLENWGVYSSKAKADVKCAELIEEYDLHDGENGSCWVEEEVVID